MTKHKVLKKFRDKYTKIEHEIGSIYEVDSKERAKELKGFIGPEIKEPKPKDTKNESSEA